MPVLDKLESILAGNVADGVAKVISTLKVDPTVALQSKTEIDKIVLEIQEKTLDAMSSSIQAVNATMQAEAKSEHWAQWMWRPMVGFTFCAVLINNYILLSYFPKLHPIDIPANVWNAILVILGAASALRGYQKVVQTQKGN